MPASSVARLAPALADSPFRVVQVEALGDDATVVIVRDGDALIPASCVSSYATRTVGEWVIVARVLEGLHVLGAVAAEPPPAVEVDLPPTVTVTYSTSPPGAGWESVSALYVRDDGAGARSLHAVIAAASTPTVQAPAPVHHVHLRDAQGRVVVVGGLVGAVAYPRDRGRVRGQDGHGDDADRLPGWHVSRQADRAGTPRAARPDDAG